MPSVRFEIGSPEELRAVRELAERAARAGGEVARRRFRGPLALRRKPDDSDVTDVDDAAQAAVLACLRAARPHDAIIAEENIPQHVAPDRQLPDDNRVSDETLCWIVDPLDGTRNYVNHVPLYAVSVAAMLAGRPVAGAVYAPERDEMYSVHQYAEPLLNGQPLAPVPPLPPLPLGRPRKPLVGIPSAIEGAAYDLMRGWVGRVIVRNLGSTALHLAMVAAGQLQAALIWDSRLWDIAAGWLLVRSTGGVMTRLDGGEIFPLDLAGYGGEPIPSLASRDPETHSRLLT